MKSENALAKFKTTHAEGIAATKAEFVKFLREGELPQESLDSVALYIYVCNRGGRESLPVGRFFDAVVADGVDYSIDYWDNPKRNAARMICPMCDGEGHVPRVAGSVAPDPKAKSAPDPQSKTKSKTRVRGL